MRRTTILHLLASAAIVPTLAACDSNGTIVAAPPPPPVVVTPPPPPPPPPPSANNNVTPCLNQTVPGTGRTVADLVVPDTLRVFLNQPSGFPNGRRYLDPVVDVTLAVIFLDLRVHSPATFASIPLNPGPSSGNILPYPTTFPFLQAPNGTPPISPVGGANFNFRTEPASAYTRIDRAGMPAVATALIGNPLRNAYNDDTPAGDATGRWVPELAAQLTTLHNALVDDLRALNLTPCSTPA
jgi:hypothetical protein